MWMFKRKRGLTTYKNTIQGSECQCKGNYFSLDRDPSMDSNQPKEIVSKWNTTQLILVQSHIMQKEQSRSSIRCPVSRESLEISNLDQDNTENSTGLESFHFRLANFKPLLASCSKCYLHVMVSHISGEWMMGNRKLLLQNFTSHCTLDANKDDIIFTVSPARGQL